MATGSATHTTWRHLKVEREQKRHNFDDARDDVDEIVGGRRVGLDVKPEVYETQNCQKWRQEKPQNVQDVPRHVLVSALLDQLHLERCQDDQGKARNVHKGCLLEANVEVRIVGVPRQITVPQWVRAERYLTHFKNWSNFIIEQKSI